MNITLAEFAVATFMGIAAGWLWVSPDSHALDAITGPFDKALSWLIRHSQLTRPLWRWVDQLQSCAPCLGFWVQLAAVGVITDWSPWTAPLALTALMLHVGWQLISGLIAAVILR